MLQKDNHLTRVIRPHRLADGMKEEGTNKVIYPVSGYK